MPLETLAQLGDRYVGAWLHLVVRHRLAVLLLTALLALTFAGLATRLHKDTSANAYIEPDNPALQYRERVIDTFGLKEPIVIAVRHAGDDGILNPQSLRLVRSLVDQLERIPNIDVDRITSLTSRNSIAGGDEGIDITPLLPAGPIDDAAVTRLRKALDDSPLYDGTLVAKDRTATVIVAELLDEQQAAPTYRAVLELTQSIPRERNEKLFVAGAAAITGYFSTYIDRDAGRLVPFTAVAVLLILFCAFFTVRSSLLPMSIAVITLVVTLGLMGASHVAFYAITNGMVVVLIGISVAEPMHVFGEYYSLLRDRSQMPHARLIIRSFLNVWRPITLTSITTMAGFFSLWVTSSMPPIRDFGLFGAIGVIVALLLTFSFLPAAMATFPRRSSRLMDHEDAAHPDPVTRAMLALGGIVIRWPRTILISAAAICAIALVAALQVRVDHARIENFNASEPLYIADQEINRTLAGTNQLDIVIESGVDDGVLTPQALQKMQALQSHLLALPEVGGAISIVDYLAQLHRAVEGDATGTIPDDPNLIAQLMLTYQASAPPTEFQALIDSSGRTALMRVYLQADRWSEQRHVVDTAQRFIDREFAENSLVATLTGRVMLDYEWVQSVASGHALSVIVSTLAVLVMCIVIFRSLRDGLLCLAPLVVSVLCVYATMGLADIWLGVATSMFASVAIGLGIDFAIHMVSRANQSSGTTDIESRLLHVFRSTGRAVLFNATAVGLGFGIVTLSAAPPVRMFGLLVSIAVLGAFVAALTVLPALMKVIHDARMRRQAGLRKELTQLLAPMLIVALVLGVPLTTARADSSQSADAVMAAVASRPEGTSADRIAQIRLIDRNGGMREQTARALRLNGDAGRRMAIFYQTPANIRGTAFLVHDYKDPARDSDQWLYLPALRKVRRVPAADRGDYFLGTDLTYDEIRNDNRVTLEDWRFRLIERTKIDGVSCSVVEGHASSDAVARELGYSRAHWWIDMASHMALRIEYWDRAGQLLKTVENRDVRQIDGVWTALQVEVTNHKTGHRTQIQFRDVRFDVPLAEALFTQQQLERGL